MGLPTSHMTPHACKYTGNKKNQHAETKQDIVYTPSNKLTNIPHCVQKNYEQKYLVVIFSTISIFCTILSALNMPHFVHILQNLTLFDIK